MIVMSDQDKGEAQQRYRGTVEVQNILDIGAQILDPKQRGIDTGQISNVPCSVMGERNKFFQVPAFKTVKPIIKSKRRTLHTQYQGLVLKMER